MRTGINLVCFLLTLAVITGCGGSGTPKKPPRAFKAGFHVGYYSYLPCNTVTAHLNGFSGSTDVNYFIEGCKGARNP